MRRICSHAALLLGIASCSDRTRTNIEAGREFALRLCAAQNECNCAEDLLIPNCEDRVEREFTENAHKALSAGLVYNSACMEDLLERIDMFATCETDYPHFGPLCPVYGADDDVGEPCQIFDVFPAMYNCRFGLSCVDGLCAEPDDQPKLPQGAICSEDQSISPTGNLGECDEGLRCDSVDTRTCVPITLIPQAPLGGECTEYSRCVDDNICRPQGDDLEPSEERPGTCVERTPPGEPCSLVYECDRICENGFCQVPPPGVCDIVRQWSELHES